MNQCIVDGPYWGASIIEPENARIVQSIEAPIGSLLIEIKWCINSRYNAISLAGMAFVFEDDINTYAWDWSCGVFTDSVTLPKERLVQYTTRTVIGYTGWAFVAGFTLKYESGATVAVGVTEDNPLYLDS